jgi:hypothetical protein
LFLAAAALPAHADRRNPLDGQPAIRNKAEMRKLRFEITPEFFMSTNQDYRFAIGAGLVLRFHITDWLNIGVHGAWTGFNPNTPLENDVRNVLQARDAANGGMYVAPETTLRMHDERVLNMIGMGSIFLSVTPWAGKFSLFSAGFASYDFFVDLGPGFVYYTQNGCCTDNSQDPNNIPPGQLPDPNLQAANRYAGAKAAGMVGVGVHIYFTQYFGLTLELRDYFANANPGGLDANGDRILDGKDERLQNNLFFGLGLTFMLPPKAKITR